MRRPLVITLSYYVIKFMATTNKTAIYEFIGRQVAMSQVYRYKLICPAISRE